MEEGVINFYNRARAYGFVETSTGRVFFHKSVVTDPSLLKEGTRVAFAAAESKKGLKATLVTAI